MTSKKNKTVKKPLRRRIRRFLRRRIFNKRAAQGSVTIFLIIIMLPMLIFSCSVIDICKIFMARNSTDGALNIAMNSRLASYDDILKDMYGILASSADEDELSKKLTEYYKLTLESSTGTNLDKDSEKYVENFFSNLFKTDMSSLDGAVQGTNGLLNLFEDSGSEFSVTPIATSSVSNPDVMHKQIVEYMKYRGPVYLATGALDKLTAFADTKNQAEAAKKQIEFEQQMNETGEMIQQVYLNLYYVMEEMESLERTSPFSHFYTQNMMYPYDGFVEEMYNFYLPSAFNCSIFASSFDDGELKYEDFVKDAFDDDYSEEDSSDGAIDELEEYLSDIDEIEEAADDAKSRFVGFGINFIKDNSSKSDSKRTVELLTDYFGVLFKDFAYTNNRDVYYFLKAYNDARGFSNYVESRLKHNISDAERENLEKDKDKADSLISRAERIVDKIEDAAESIKDVMEYEYNDILLQSFNGEMVKMSYFYISVRYINSTLEYLISPYGIDMVVKELEKTAEYAEKYGEAIGKVKVEDTRAGMQGVYEKNAAKVQDVAGKCSNGLNELKSILEYLGKVYKAQQECIESMTFLADYDYNIINNVVFVNKVKTKADYYITYFSDFLPRFHKPDEVKEWFSYEKFMSNYRNGINVGEMLSAAKSGHISNYFDFEPKTGVENLQHWNCKNEEIKNNSFYLLVKENSGGNAKEKTQAEKEAENTANNQKKEIVNLGKEVSANSDEGKNPTKDGEKTEDDNQDSALKFIPKTYPTFADYVGDVKAVYSGNGVKDNLLNELNENSFSFSKSESSDNFTPGANKMNDDLATGAANALESIGNFFSNLLTATRDDLYIAEYLTENFPCVTTCKGKEKTAQMISGEMFYSNGKANVVCAHSSLEYILYGNMDGDEKEPAASVVKASAVLFGVRFVLNLIYALTSADLAAQIEPIIAPLEAIPFAGPIARTVILIGLALGESAIDVGLLCSGEKVALFKSISTWICSPKGVVSVGGKTALNTALGLVEDTAGMLIDKGSEELIKAEDNLANALMDGTDNVKGEIDAYAEEMLKSMREEVENDVFNPIFTTIRSCISEFKSRNALPSPDDIYNSLSKSIGVAKENLGLNEASASDDLARKAEAEIFAYMESNIQNFASVIYNKLTSFTDIANTAINGEIDALEKEIKTQFSGLVDKIDEQFKAGTGKLCESVKEKIGSAAESLKGKTKNMGQALKAELKASINEKVRGTKSAYSKVNLSKSSSAGGSSDKLFETKGKDFNKTDKTLCISYEDYMYVFTVLGLAFNEGDMLMRASQLMNANIEFRIDGNTRSAAPQNAYNSEVTYNINKAYTLFKGEAGSKTRTMFLGTTWNKENQQWILPASNVYSYKATTYVGY